MMSGKSGNLIACAGGGAAGAGRAGSAGSGQQPQVVREAGEQETRCGVVRPAAGTTEQAALSLRLGAVPRSGGRRALVCGAGPRGGQPGARGVPTASIRAGGTFGGIEGGEVPGLGVGESRGGHGGGQVRLAVVSGV